MHILQLSNEILAVSAGDVLDFYKPKTFDFLLEIDIHSGEINSFSELRDGSLVICSDESINVI